MNDTMRFVDLLPDTREWHDWRRNRVTASLAAVVVGRSPYKTRWQLAAEMLGIIEPEDLSRNPLVNHGKAYEDVIRRQLEAEFGDMLMPVCGEHIEYPDIGASFDALDAAGAPVEIKSVHPKTFGDVTLNREHSEAYGLYWFQVQHQIYVAGARNGRLAFGIEGERPIVFTVDRDDSFLSTYVPLALDFIATVRGGKLPPKDPSRDAYHPADAEMSAVKQLVFAHKVARSVRGALEAQVEAQKAAEAELETKLVRMMGAFAEGQFLDAKVTRTYRRGQVDYDALIRDHIGDLPQAELDLYRKPGAVRIAVTHQDVGARQVALAAA